MDWTPADTSEKPFRRWIPSRAFWHSVAIGSPVSFGGAILTTTGWSTLGFVVLAVCACLFVFVGLMPARFTMDAKDISLWWFSSRRIPLARIEQASASRTRWGDYLHVTLQSGETLSILTRVSLASTLVLSTPISATDAFPTELISRLIESRARAARTAGASSD